MENLGQKGTTDVWFSSFLIKSGHKISSYDVIERGKLKCYFDLSEDQWKKLKLAFNNSEISEFKQIIDKLKDLCY
jgi:uncharacterized protein YicC (UPF0701 family)